LEEGSVARRLFLGDLEPSAAVRSGRSWPLEECCACEREGGSRHPPIRQQVGRYALPPSSASLRALGETLAKTLVGLAIRVAAKVTAYTYGLYVNRLFGRPQGRIKELWA
jgi:hypothetical protein